MMSGTRRTLCGARYQQGAAGRPTGREMTRTIHHDVMVELADTSLPRQVFS